MYDSQIDVTNQYLTFTLDDELFALEIGSVREVMYSIEITRVPRMPKYYTGVINLRGNVVSVIDLKYLLGLGEIEKGVDTCIIIVELGNDDDQMQMGVLADSVQEVIHFPAENILPPPKIGAKLNSEYIQGVGKRDDEFIIILNIERVLETENLASTGSTSEKAEKRNQKDDADGEENPNATS